MVDWVSGVNGKPLKWSQLEGVLSGTYPQEFKLANVGGSGSGSEKIRYYSSQPFAELHAASYYHFLHGANSPQDMVAAACQQGMSALALIDRDGFYGAMEFAEAAATSGLPTVFGAELTLAPDRILTVLARGVEGYTSLSRLITQARMRGSKDVTIYPPLAEIVESMGKNCRFLLNHSWCTDESLLEIFDPDTVVLEYGVTMRPEDVDHHELLDSIRQRYGFMAIASAVPSAVDRVSARVAGAKQALAQRESLPQATPRLHPMGSTWMRGGDELAGSVDKQLLDASVEVARDCAFALDLVAPNLPRWPVPDEMAHLTGLVNARFDARYRGRSEDVKNQARAQIHHELAVIKELGFPGYFLIVDDIVSFCHTNNILCQGRGSAANSVVCFVLGITNVEPISTGLLFERFLSRDREGPPDIDIDIESGRRDAVITYVYDTYGRDNAAQVANVITYRTKAALRDAARALGYPNTSADAWSTNPDEAPNAVRFLAEQLKGQPRHLGIHAGGMVICDRPIADVVPTEWARKHGRSVVQWDKESCASAGLVKFDLLGLGMLEALHHMIDLVVETTGTTINLWEIDLAEPEIYTMLSNGDAVGVFQVESRAQLATLPRLRPREFFDLVVEVALVRPGPIQGGSVHPYIRRRNGLEAVTYEHPILERSLRKTLGVPLFQEQLMHIAVDAAGFSGGEADELRRAMGSRRSVDTMNRMKRRFFAGLRRNNITGDIAGILWNKIVAFAAYGFPESHSQSFASLVYFSAWFKYHHPAEFYVGLLRAQPMGFYSPQSLLADARRKELTILSHNINKSQVEATVENGAIRLGLNMIKGVGKTEAEAIVAHAPYRDIADLSRRAGLGVAVIEALARSGALETLGVGRRQALWQAGAAATEKAAMLPGLSMVSAPSLPGMNAFELIVADIAMTGVSSENPVALLRRQLELRGVIPASELLNCENARRILLAGVVTHRQRPQTAAGVTFLGLEDETGLANVVVSVGLWKRSRAVKVARAVLVRGVVHNADGVASVTADRVEELPFAEMMSAGSRDFR
ncbi:error-prone DNA polymerase [Corynebacterium diphtheriae]|uniref:error-prone DNA polymerase n=1 Tax=Corynebacterium diphtheriae TaxID=1717 RepID=UPI0013C8D8B5|nr:error-prone DNA polymerase [Corynebacterium diphtheriae]CAB0538953.1 error-prone DNA polymerase [Corynebacterium diphtheriae]CAB0781735.1 error-prone DNA polymerase [Corynebacterium diphtheriae]